MLNKIKQLLCGLMTRHDLVRDGGVFVCSLCMKKVEWYKPIYPIAMVPKEMNELYEYLLDHEMNLGPGG